MIKLVVTDIDDTLVNSRNEISKKNREVITLHRNMDVPKLIEDLTLENKTIFIEINVC